MQWLHLTAAVLALGGIGFMLLALLPSLGILDSEESAALFKAVAGRFRWVSWSAILVLIGSGLYNVRRFYWEVPWDRGWKFLAVKVILSFSLFAIVLALTIPLRILEPARARRKILLQIAFGLGVVILLISAYLRRG
jgi:uncharacterized membrane protein